MPYTAQHTTWVASTPQSETGLGGVLSQAGQRRAQLATTTKHGRSWSGQPRVGGVSAPCWCSSATGAGATLEVQVEGLISLATAKQFWALLYRVTKTVLGARSGSRNG